MSDRTFQNLEGQFAPNRSAATTQQQCSSYWGSQALPEGVLAARRPIAQQQPMGYQDPAAQQHPMSYAGPQTQQQSMDYPVPVPFSTQVSAPAAMPQQSDYPAPATHPLSTESFVGGKILGIIAAVLVVTGMFLLGVTLVPHLSEFLKTVFMFLIALALTGVGIATTRRARNVFSQTLLSCGLLSFFGSVMAMHSEYGAAVELPALLLTVVWMAATIVIVLAVRSWPVSMVLLASTALLGIAFMETVADNGEYALPFFVSIAYCIALGITCIKLAAEAPGHPNSRRALASLFVVEAGLLLAPVFSQWHHAASVALVLIAVVLIALKLVPLPASLLDSERAMRIGELAILSLMVPALAVASAWSRNAFDIACGGMFIVGAVVLTALHIRDLAASNAVESSPAIPVVHAAAMTGLVLSYLFGYTGWVHSVAILNAIAMGCALAAIVVGFGCNHKPLRVYGLIVMLLCVLKIVAWDMTGTDLERGIAFVVGGLVCFGVSALYTYASKHVRA